MPNDDIDLIRTGACDVCNWRGPVVVLHDRGCEALAACRACQPRQFDRVARRDVDGWLGLPR